MKKIRAALRAAAALARNRRRPSPLLCIVETTYRCNMRCAFCNVPRLDEKSRGDEMTAAELRALLKEAGGMGAFLAYFTGGEPLLREDIGESLRTAGGEGMLTLMSTNGYFVEERLAELRGSLDYVRISIDSLRIHDELRGCPSALARALKAVEACRRSGIDVNIVSTVSSKTIGEMEELARLAAEAGVTIVFAPLMTIPKAGRQELDIDALLPDPSLFASEARRLRERYRCVEVPERYLRLVEAGGIGKAGRACRAAQWFLTVNPQGELILPCNDYPLYRASIRAGDVRKAWESSGAGGIRAAMERYPFCGGCVNKCYVLPSLLFTAGGLCSAAAEWLRGSGRRGRKGERQGRKTVQP